MIGSTRTVIRVDTYLCIHGSQNVLYASGLDHFILYLVVGKTSDGSGPPYTQDSCTARAQATPASAVCLLMRRYHHQKASYFVPELGASFQPRL
jgi:hypothetical protein